MLSLNIETSRNLTSVSLSDDYQIIGYGKAVPQPPAVIRKCYGKIPLN